MAVGARLRALAEARELRIARVFERLLYTPEARSRDAHAALGISRAEWVGLRSGADELRELVQMQLDTDEDLHAAQAELAICDDFFERLAELGGLRGVDIDGAEADAAQFELMRTL